MQVFHEVRTVQPHCCVDAISPCCTALQRAMCSAASCLASATHIHIHAHAHTQDRCASQHTCRDLGVTGCAQVRDDTQQAAHLDGGFPMDRRHKRRCAKGARLSATWCWLSTGALLPLGEDLRRPFSACAKCGMHCAPKGRCALLPQVKDMTAPKTAPLLLPLAADVSKNPPDVETDPDAIRGLTDEEIRRYGCKCRAELV